MEDERCSLYHSIGCEKCYIPGCPYDRLPVGSTISEAKSTRGNEYRNTLIDMQIAGWCAECYYFQSHEDSPEPSPDQLSLELGEEEYDRMQFDYDDNPSEPFNVWTDQVRKGQRDAIIGRWIVLIGVVAFWAAVVYLLFK